MQNAKKFNDRITIGLVPGADDLKQLKELGYKTLIDLRDKEELFGGYVHKHARELGLDYINIPVHRDAIQLSDVKAFYEKVHARGSAPLYVFSRLGRKPLVFLLLFEAVANNQPLVRIYRRANKLGFHLEGDLAFQKFLYSLHNSEEFARIVDAIRQSREDLFNSKAVQPSPEEQFDFEVDGITEQLLQITSTYARNKDINWLRQMLTELSATLAKKTT
jgi:protein tyrosine phosphatase (PTP) superfamily phosphohydrolase (DUF442 family)